MGPPRPSPGLGGTHISGRRGPRLVAHGLNWNCPSHVRGVWLVVSCYLGATNTIKKPSIEAEKKLTTYTKLRNLNEDFNWPQVVGDSSDDDSDLAGVSSQLHVPHQPGQEHNLLNLGRNRTAKEKELVYIIRSVLKHWKTVRWSGLMKYHHYKKLRNI